MRTRRIQRTFVVALAIAPLVLFACRRSEPSATQSASTSSTSGSDAAPAPGDCVTHADCHLASDYCGGCNCIAVPSGRGLPPCDGNTVQCFADPCMNKTAACVDGACVAR